MNFGARNPICMNLATSERLKVHEPCLSKNIHEPQKRKIHEARKRKKFHEPRIKAYKCIK